ncbi:hypothetical protein F4780DRAFT_308089 [Xylariomycetidae sp. FL0641]|nr:hypothetical protein F4780DRAFT_308089 [Xylariomycetidae sp. FL0641]
MDSTISYTRARFGEHHAFVRHVERWVIVPQGVMMGTGLCLFRMSHDASFLDLYYPTVAMFGLATLAYNGLHWQALLTFYFVPVSIFAAVVILLQTQPEICMASVLDSIPILIMLASLVIDKLDTLQPGLLKVNDHIPTILPPMTLGSWRRLAHEAETERISPDLGERHHQSRCPCGESILHYIQPCEGLRTPSSRSSDISLTVAELESLPSSWCSKTRRFFPKLCSRRGDDPSEDLFMDFQRSETV